MCAVRRLASPVKNGCGEKKKERNALRYPTNWCHLCVKSVYSCVWLVRVALCAGMFSQTWRCMAELCMWACTHVRVCQYRPTIIRAASHTHTDLVLHNSCSSAKKKKKNKCEDGKHLDKWRQVSLLKMETSDGRKDKMCIRYISAQPGALRGLISCVCGCSLETLADIAVHRYGYRSLTSTNDHNKKKKNNSALPSL